MITEKRNYSMDQKTVTESWIYNGLSDLYFAFECDAPDFEYQERFFEIMGLEKFLKAVMLFHNSSKYEALSNSEAREIVNKLVIEWGHDFKKMIKLVHKFGVNDIEKIKETDFDGYIGNDLIRAVKEGYLETRYPVPRQISETFPIPGTKFTHNPLGSSGFTKFIYAVCNSCFYHLMPYIKVNLVMNEFKHKYNHRKSFYSFNNLFLEERCNTTLSQSQLLKPNTAKSE